MFEYRYKNIFYVESKNGIKYLWNHGYINIDNPKIAARYFLNAIDRVEPLKEKYQKSLLDIDQNISLLQQMVVKPFGKEVELSQLKSDVSKLEREISIKIQKNQMKHEETPVIKMEHEERKLLIKKEPKKKSLRI